MYRKKQATYIRKFWVDGIYLLPTQCHIVASCSLGARDPAVQNCYLVERSITVRCSCLLTLTDSMTDTGYRQNPPATKPPSWDYTLFKVSYLCFTVNIVIEKDRSIVHDVFYVHYVAQKLMVYIGLLQFNENIKHKFRRLYCYILFPVCF